MIILKGLKRTIAEEPYMIATILHAAAPPPNDATSPNVMD